jgi:hypothetical protein
MAVIKKIRNKLFPPHFSFLHWLGKDFVSPLKKMKRIIQESFAGSDVKTIMDFGSGTLVWADYFAKELNCQVYAVDTFYAISPPKTRNHIVLYTDFKKCFNDVLTFSCIWACDVFHHIPQEIYDDFMEEAVKKADVIIIKDNDSNHGFGFLMNRIHDRIINGEKIYDVYPDKIAAYLKSQGFHTQYYYMPKLWFPHFMLVAKRVPKERGVE